MALDVELLPAQREFMQMPDNDSLRDIALYQGGYGSGKTFIGSLIGILLCLKYEGIRGLVCALTFPLVRDTTLKQYIEHLDKAGFMEGVHYTFNKSENIIRFKNGSEILFRYAENPEVLKSLNLGFVELEEMSNIPESTFKMLLSRLRQEIKPEWKQKGFKYRLFGHTNPESSKGWIYKYFVEQKPDYYRLIQAPTTENKYLASDYVESLKEIYDPEYYRINVLGEFGDYTSGLVVKNFTSDNIKDVQYVDNIPLHITCDFNVDPMCWLLAFITNNKVFYFDEIIIENTYTRQTAEEFINRYGKHKAPIIVNGDASGNYRKTQSDISDYMIIRDVLKEHYRDVAIEIRPFNPPIKNRIAAFNRMVCDYNGNRRVIVSPKCKRFLYNIYNLKYKAGTTIVDVPSIVQIQKDNNLKFLEHPFDAGSYLVEYYFPISEGINKE